MNQQSKIQALAFLLLAYRTGERVYYGDATLFVKCEAQWPAKNFATDLPFEGIAADASEVEVAAAVSAQVFGQKGCVKGKPVREGAKPKEAGIGIALAGREALLPPAAAPQVDASQFGQPNGEA